MNIAVIFAGGTGQRMNLVSKPKQFLEVCGKPIIIYTLEQFQYCDQIDSIILVCLKDWICYSKELTNRYNISKLTAIIEGGVSGQESIYHGLCKAKELFGDDNIVLIHDGVRPLIDTETITSNIALVKNYRCAITIAPAIETIFLKEEDGSVGSIIDRSKCQLARAPQSFVLKDIFEAHNRAINDRLQFIDSASMMQYYGYKLFCVEGKPDNIKITTIRDYYFFKAFLEAKKQL